LKKLLFFSLLALASCSGYKELPVDYDYSYKGRFEKYRTFDLMRPLNISDSSMINKSIEKSIAARMRFLGYKKTSIRPHLLISYKMFYDSLKFNGYDQPEIESWEKNKKEDLNYRKRKYNMKAGTLLIQFFDRRQNRSIWQGYATALYGDIDFGNERHVRNAVISILDKYRFWAQGFLEHQPIENEEGIDNQ
jgi:hypothetical protein